VIFAVAQLSCAMSRAKQSSSFRVLSKYFAGKAGSAPRKKLACTPIAKNSTKRDIQI